MHLVIFDIFTFFFSQQNGCHRHTKQRKSDWEIVNPNSSSCGRGYELAVCRESTKNAGHRPLREHLHLCPVTQFSHVEQHALCRHCWALPKGPRASQHLSGTSAHRQPRSTYRGSETQCLGCAGSDASLVTYQWCCSPASAFTVLCFGVFLQHRRRPWKVQLEYCFKDCISKISPLGTLLLTINSY